MLKELKINLLRRARSVTIIIVTLLILISSPIILPGELHAITLRELGNSIAQLSKEEENLLEEILISEVEVENKRNKLNSLNEQIGILEKELEELNKTKDELNRSIESKKEALKEKIIFSYKYANDDIARLIITAGDLNEFINNIYIFKNIMESQADLIEQLRFEKEEYDRISRKSEEKKKEIENTRDAIKEEEQQLLKSIEENKVLLERVKKEKGEIQNLLSEIKKRIAMVQPPGLTLVGEWDMVATAYYAHGKGGNDINGNGITAIGLRARKGIVAVDPRVIPLGTRLYIPGYGEALAADTGGWIKNNRIDLCFETMEDCYRYGRRKIKVYLVED
ncbi:MAG: 3D domain-containing protein [Actinomycetota bacterium]|nr:3D domain-containing protein [Actinomycetota bacterium]